MPYVEFRYLFRNLTLFVSVGKTIRMQIPITNTILRWKDIDRTIGEVHHGHAVSLGFIIRSGDEQFQAFSYESVPFEESAQRGLPLLFLAGGLSKTDSPLFHRLVPGPVGSLAESISFLTGEQTAFTEVFDTFAKQSEAKFATHFLVTIPSLPPVENVLSLSSGEQKTIQLRFIQELISLNPDLPSSALQRAFLATWGRYPDPRAFSKGGTSKRPKASPVSVWPEKPLLTPDVREIRDAYIVETYKLNQGCSLKGLSSALKDKFGIELTGFSIQKIINRAGIDTSRGKKPRKKQV